MKIYTRTGDKGQTGLFSGRRVSKADPRVEAYGTVDELNACLGLLRDHLPPPPANPASADGYLTVRDQLLAQQQYLFSLGAALADDRESAAYQMPEESVTRLEEYIDEMEAELPQMRHFILPGGSQRVSLCHLARTICRRAERRSVEVEGVGATEVRYLNRLSDYLFVLSRHLGRLEGIEEIKWKP